MIPTGGIFETLRVYSGRAFKLDEHLARLRRSADRLQIEPPPDIEERVLGHISRTQNDGLADAFVRITLSPANQNPREVSTLDILIDQLPELDERWYTGGIRMMTAEDRRDEFARDAGIKTTALLASILEFRASNTPDADDHLYLDTRGHICEGSASNIFLYTDGVLNTPPLSCGVLPGITRTAVIEMAAGMGIPLSDSQSIEPAMIDSAAEIFLTSSIREIVPVISVDKKTVGSGVPGHLTRSLMRRYQEITRCK